MTSEVNGCHAWICRCQVGITRSLWLGVRHQIGHRVEVSYTHRLAAVVGWSTVYTVALFALCQQRDTLIDVCRQLIMSVVCIVAISQRLSEVDIVIGPDRRKLHLRVVLCVGLCVEAVINRGRYLTVSIAEVTVSVARFYIATCSLYPRKVRGRNNAYRGRIRSGCKPPHH